MGTLFLYGLLRLQSLVPGGPDSSFLATPLTPDLALNTAVSFSTTTTWQAYGGETTMKYWTQLIGLAGQNFMAGAAGLAVGIAFIRAFARKQSATVGNFWGRSHTLDALDPPAAVDYREPAAGCCRRSDEFQPLQLGPNSGGGSCRRFPRVPSPRWNSLKTSAPTAVGISMPMAPHPFENPTPLSNFIAMLAIAVLPAALTHTFGRMTHRPRAGWALYWVMAILFVGGLLVCDVAERTGNPHISSVGVAGQTMGVMEGKEVRFGHAGSVLAIITTSNGATGSYNCMHDSLTPIGSAIPLVNMLLGEITFGGLGTGLYSMVMVILVGLFMSGLMVGRTPEYLGKKLGPSEMKQIALFTLLTPVAVLPLTALALVTRAGLAGLTTNTGPHGFTEVLFAYASCCANNGQVMAGLSANTPFYNMTTLVAMMAGRFGLAIPALALCRPDRAPGDVASLTLALFRPTRCCSGSSP